MSNDEIIKCQMYYEEVIPRMTCSTFRSHFRMTPMTFEAILVEIADKPEFAKRDEILYGGREQVNPEKCLLVALWTLATPDSYRSIGDRFNISKSTVLYCLNTSISIINTYLCPKFIKWPDDDNEKQIISMNFNRYGMSNVIATIDGCHIPIKRPSENGNNYFNRKKFYSVVLQAVAKHNLMFIDVDVSWPGSVHDARVFRTSDLYVHGQNLCQPDYFILADSAYPCLTWIIPPFKNNGHLTPMQVYFNTILSKTRVNSENAFALLKGRFRRIRDLLDRNNVQEICETIVACCVLHNICLVKGGEDILDFIDEGRQNNADLPMDHGWRNYDEHEGSIRRYEIMLQLWNNRQNI